MTISIRTCSFCKTKSEKSDLLRFVRALDGEVIFDKNNFELSISANHRYKFAGRYIFAIRKANGKTQEFQNKWMIEQMLSPQEFELLRAKIVGWFQAVSA